MMEHWLVNNPSKMKRLERLAPLLLLLLCALEAHAQPQCLLTRTMIEQTDRIFMLRSRSRNLRLKRTVSSPVGEVMQMFCTTRDTFPTTCQANLLYNPPLPLRCHSTRIPSVTQIVSDRNCPHTMYRVGYHINNQFLELYRSCFDRATVRTLFVLHQVYAKPFIPARPCVRFTSDGVLTAAEEASYSARSIYNVFQRLFGPNQYITNPTDIVINRGHMAPSADFFFGDHMCATFKYVNVVPQFKDINDSNWERIERYVRGLVVANQFVNVRTGATGVLSLPDPRNPRNHKQVFLNGRRNPVPEWTYKVVRTSSNVPIAAFLTFNNIFAAQQPLPPRFCRTVQCPFQMPLVIRDGYTFCCNTTNFNPPV